MKKQILLNLFLFTFLFAAPVFAQRLETEIKIQRPDYSGTWNLNEKKSTGIKKNGGRDAELSFVMVIEQNLPAIGLTIKHQRGTAPDANFFGGKITLYADGRGDEYIPSMDADSSVTVWNNNKLLVTHYTLSEPKQVNCVQEFAVSADGNTLTNTVRHYSFRYSLDKKGNYQEEYYFDESQILILVFDKVR